MTDHDIKVSVAMITYNHEKFIAQAIESVLAQRVSFPIEIVIGDDCSTDATPAILQRFAAAHPGTIQLLHRSMNIGMLANFQSTIENCRGEYVALLEGDDFWTVPDKLQRQVNFLDRHPDYSICHHNALAFYDNASHSRPWHRRRVPSTLTLCEMFEENKIVTCTALFRNKLFQFPTWFVHAPVGDWPLHLLNARFGHVGYLNCVMGAYRIHASSNWSQLDRMTHATKMVATLALVSQELSAAETTQLTKAQRSLQAEVVELFVKRGELENARDYCETYLGELQVFHRIENFQRALNYEAQGMNRNAYALLQAAKAITSPDSHLTWGDIQLALLRCRFPMLYRSLRWMWRKVRRS